MLSFLRTVGIFFAILFLLQASLTAAEPDARKIMEFSNARFQGKNRSAGMEMTLIDKFNTEKTYSILSFQNDIGTTLFKAMFFTAPLNVRGTAFLIYDYSGPVREDVQWLHLPALHKTSRIESTDQGNSFMGSDFSVYDMSRKNLDNYDFQIIDQSKVNEHEVWLVKSIPRSSKIMEQDGYEKSVFYIRKDNYVIIRAVHWVNGTQDLKYYSVKKLELLNNIWVPLELHMTLKRDRKKLHKTIFKIFDVKFDQEFDKDFFSKEQLEKKSALICAK